MEKNVSGKECFLFKSTLFHSRINVSFPKYFISKNIMTVISERRKILVTMTKRISRNNVHFKGTKKKAISHFQVKKILKHFFLL